MTNITKTYSGGTLKELLQRYLADQAAKKDENSSEVK